MAIIKCPECGHQISDKAPVCPSCGVEIAGKITRCPECGEVYFKDETACPNCHHATEAIANAKPQQPADKQPAQPQPANIQQPSRSPMTPKNPTSTPPTPPTKPTTPPSPQPKKSHRNQIIAALICLLVIIGMVFYFNHGSSNDNKEQEAYEYAMQSSDPAVLQSYLANYPDADEAHRDSIQAHLAILQQGDLDWTNAVMSGSKSALEDYLQKHPDSEHRTEALAKIDSLDWQYAKNQNSLEALQTYIAEHSDGAHIDEANDALKKLKAKDLQPEEKQMISGLFRRFFQSINSRNEGGLTSTVEPVMTSFLGKSGATKSDVAEFLNKIYKEDITNMNWFVNNDYKIKKREVGDMEYEYSVDFSAREEIERTDETQSTGGDYRISAKVSPSGKISEFTMVKILK